MYKLSIGLFMALLLSSHSIFGKGSFIDEEASGNMVDDDFIETPWVEEKHQLPPFPKDDDWLEFETTVEASSFTYFLNESSLYVGESDGVVRYLIKIQSKTGGSNIAYEALRCTSIEYKVLAFGMRGNKFRKIKDPQWKPIIKGGVTRYRFDLMDAYFCTVGTEKTKEEIINSIKYPNVGRQSDFIDGMINLY